jgi:excisionase family DNA binding protein
MLTIDSLAQMIGLSTRTIRRMLDKGDLPFAMKVKGSWRFQEEDVFTWLQKSKITENPVQKRDKKQVLLDLADQFSKLHIPKKTQAMLIDLLPEFFENNESCLKNAAVREFFEYFLPRLDSELIDITREVSAKLNAIYRKNLPEKDLVRQFLSLFEKRFGTDLTLLKRVQLYALAGVK